MQKLRKTYRVIKENFLWEKGAILEYIGEEDGKEKKGYRPIHEAYCLDNTGSEFIHARIVENRPEYFEEVYLIPGEAPRYGTRQELLSVIGNPQ